VVGTYYHYIISQDCGNVAGSVSTATRLRSGRPGFDSQQGEEFI